MKKMFLSTSVGKMVTGALSLGILTLFFVFTSSSLSAQSLSATAGYIPAETFKDAVTQFGENFQSKAAALELVKDEIEFVRNDQTSSPLEEATNSVRYDFLIAVGKGLKQDKAVQSSLIEGYGVALERANDFSINIDVDAIFIEYYSLLSI